MVSSTTTACSPFKEMSLSTTTVLERKANRSSYSRLISVFVVVALGVATQWTEVQLFVTRTIVPPTTLTVKKEAKEATSTVTEGVNSTRATEPDYTQPQQSSSRRRRPRCVLEMSGGLRTFPITWPLLQQHIVTPNGGRDNFVIVLSATYHKNYTTQLAPSSSSSSSSSDESHTNPQSPKKENTTVLQMIQDDITADFDHVRLVPDDNTTRVCEFYNVSSTSNHSTCTMPKHLLHFPHQWESVTTAHDWVKSPHRQQDTKFDSDDIQLYIRIRPDVILMSDVNLTAVHDTLQAVSKDLWIPCTEDRFHWPTRFIDDFAIGTAAGMNVYATKYPITNGARAVLAEEYIYKIAKDIAHTAILADYGLLRLRVLPTLLNQSAASSSPFDHWTSSRCRPVHSPKTFAYTPNDVPGYNAAHVNVMLHHFCQPQ